MAEPEDDELVSPAGLYMHPQPEHTAQPAKFVDLQARRSLVAPSGPSQPGCLAALTTLSWPLEQSVHQVSERFSHALEEVKSRVTNLWSRLDDVAEQTAVLGQRQGQMDSRAADLERQQSRLSDDLSSRVSDSEMRQSQLSEDVQSLSSSFERSTSDLGRRTQELEEQAVDAEARSQALFSEVEQLKEQMTEVVSKLNDIQVQSKNGKNQEGSCKETLSLLERLNSMEKGVQKLETSFPPHGPKRSISAP